MSVDSATVRRVAGHARNPLSEAEADALVAELAKRLGFGALRAACYTRGGEPRAAVIPIPLRLRDDVVTDGGDRDAVLANAPQAEHGFFAVPKVSE